MTLEFRAPYQIDPNAPGPEQRRLAALNQTISGIGQNWAENSRQSALMKLQQQQADRENRKFYAEYGDPSFDISQSYTMQGPMGPPPPQQGMVDWSKGVQGPEPQQTPQTPTDQFMEWKKRQPQDPMSRYQAMLSDPRVGSVRARAYLEGQKEQTDFQKTQSEIEKNKAMAEMYRHGGAGAGKGTWHLDPMTGLMTFYPNAGPASPGYGGAPTPSGTMPGSGPGVPNTGPGGAPLPYKDRVKLEMEKPKALGSLNNTLREYDNMIAEAEAIKNDPDLGYATGLLTPLSRIPGTGAKRVSARLETLKAKTLLNVLSSLKELSSNGSSGFGALSNVEGENIRNSISTLDPHQSTQDLQGSIDRFIKEMHNRKNTLRDTFTSTYGDSGIPQDSGPGQNVPAGGAGPTAAPQFQAIKRNPTTGKSVGWNGSQWVPIP